MYCDQKGELKKAKGRFRKRVLRLLTKINHELSLLTDPALDKDKKFISNLIEYLEEGISVAVDYESLKAFRFYLFERLEIES